MSSNENDIILLESEHLLDINDMIQKKSKEKKEIGYSGEDIYPIQINKIRALIKQAPTADILTIATYYLKNIILLQPFPDGNHRTALASVEFFLSKNGHKISYSAEKALEFQKQAYSVRLKTYGHYDQHNTSVLTKQEDDFNSLCRTFIEGRLAESD